MSRRPTMVALAEEYLAERRRLGFDLLIAGRQLLSFARYADASGHRGPITTELAVRWATLPGQAPRKQPGRRLEIVRPFARYRAALDAGTEVVPVRLLGSRRRPPPFIYSEAQVVALITAARKLSPAGSLRPRTYAVLIGLLAASGLRISEALALGRADVDLERGILTVKKTKFRKSRLVPLHPSTVAALRSYATQRDALASSSTAFLTSDRGDPLPYSTVRTVFKKLRSSVFPASRGIMPRIHDLRHSFACRRVLRWCEEGADVGRHIAALSTYLGHAKVSDTYWYLSATAEILAVAGARFGRFGGEEGGQS